MSSSALLPNTGIPALDALADGSAWTRWRERYDLPDWPRPLEKLRYLRLKPGVSARLALFDQPFGRESGDGEPPTGFLLRLDADPERSRAAHEKMRAHHAEFAGRRAFHCEEPPALIAPFPLDPTLPRLRRVFEPERLRRWLQRMVPEHPLAEWRIKKRSLRPRLIAYKPERRAVFRVDLDLRRRQGDEKVLRPVYLKVAPRDALRRAREFQTALRATGSGGPFDLGDQPLDEGGVLARPWRPGSTLDTLLDGSSTTVNERLRQAGRLVGRLHSLRLDLDHQPSPIEEQQRLRSLGEDLTRLLPEHSADIQRTSQRLERALALLAREPSAVVHGDLHPGQILVGEDGLRLLDFDHAGRGYRARDLGRFVAHLVEIRDQPDGIDAFLEGAGATGEAISPDILHIATTHALFERAMAPFRSLDPRWREQVLERLDRVDRRLETSP